MAAKSAQLTAIFKVEDGLVQVVVDNFDADIVSQNGKLSTRSLLPIWFYHNRELRVTLLS